MKSILARSGIAGAISLLAIGVAQAGSVNQPGFTTGAPVYGAFPEGLYLIAIPEYGIRSTIPSTTLNAFTPFFFYQSPWNIAGFDIAAVFSPIVISTQVGNGPYQTGLYNTYGGVQFTHQFGNGWGAGFRLGGFTPGGPPEGYTYGTFDTRFGVTYLKDGTDFTLNFNPGFPIEGGQRTAPNYFNVDLTATKTFGKWEVGLVGFGSTDLDSPFLGYKKQSQIALGPLVGYNFGPVDIQLKFTEDVMQHNYGGYDRRAWADIIIPLGSIFGKNDQPSAAAPHAGQRPAP